MSNSLVSYFSNEGRMLQVLGFGGFFLKTGSVEGLSDIKDKSPY